MTIASGDFSPKVQTGWWNVRSNKSRESYKTNFPVPKSVSVLWMKTAAAV
jgi:hypothetical protein